jgi:hypothetical protein
LAYPLDNFKNNFFDFYSLVVAPAIQCGAWWKLRIVLIFAFVLKNLFKYFGELTSVKYEEG